MNRVSFSSPLVRSVLTAAVIGICSVAAHAAVPPWLYRVDVPVESQAAAERGDASRVAIAELLTRLTGATRWPGNPTIGDALRAPERYYSGYTYATRGDRLWLQFDFDPRAVTGLVRRSGVDVWPVNRPVLVAWIADPESNVLARLDREGSAIDFVWRARQRGVPVQLPLMDVEDQQLVDADDVRNARLRTLDRASQRYGADGLLIGALSDSGGGVKLDAQLRWDGLVRRFSRTADSGDEVFEALSAWAADALLERQAVAATSGELMSLAVRNVATPGAYAALLRYLQANQLVRAVHVTRVREGVVELTLAVTASEESMVALFRRDGRLADASEVPDAILSAVREMVWRDG